MRLIHGITLLLFAAACSESASDPTASGSVDGGTIVDTCTAVEPCDVTLGASSNEFIFPVGDVDTYAFTVPEPGRVISVTVANDAQFSPVTYQVVLIGPAGERLDDRRGGRGVQRIVIQQVASAAGRYTIEVRDVGNDDEDSRNPYALRVDLLSETDDNEPNDAPAAAVALTENQPTVGAIGTQGDEDWFRITVPANRLVEIEMTSVCPTEGTSPVRLSWSLSNANSPEQPLASRLEPACPVEGGILAWPIEARAVGNAAGEYLLVVRDDDGREADLNRTYTLRVRLVEEPDPQDLAAPNETPQTATVITSGQTVNGFIAATADVDYYAIEVTGASQNNPYLLVVEASMGGLSPVDLAFTVLERDAQTEICEQRDGDLCKALRFAPDGAERQASLRTSHPIFRDGTYYVLVRDFQENDADQGVGYTLTVRLEREVDTNEDFRQSGRDVAVLIPTTTGTSADPVVFEWAEGYISHANDQDWYRFDIPGDQNLAPGHNGDYLIQLELQMPGPTPVELEAFFYGPRGSSRQSYGGYGKRCRRPDNPEDPEPCQFPDEENVISETFGEANGDCFVVFREVTNVGPHYFRMTDLDRDDFDLGARYRLRVTLSPGCPSNSVCAGRFEGPNGDLCGR